MVAQMVALKVSSMVAAMDEMMDERKVLTWLVEKTVGISNHLLIH
jgi:hypothetical protein